MDQSFGGRQRTPADGHPDVNLFDLSLKVDLCAVTLLQSWFIALEKLGAVTTLAQPVMQGVEQP